MSRYNWNAIPVENLTALLSRQAIHTPSKTIARLTLAKGAIVPMHSHVNEQVTWLVSGKLRFEMEDHEGKTIDIFLGPGDVLVIPPDVPHLVETLEDSVATDIFTPARADWIAGNDAYLRK